MILRGLAKLARFDASGMAEFTGSSESFNASLAPLIAFPLVGGVLSVLAGDWRGGVLGFLARLCAVLAVPVLVHEFARVFGRNKEWLRAAVALNWSFWLVLPALLVGAVIGAIMITAHLPAVPSESAALALVGLYLLGNRWFVLRVGMGIGWWRALLVTLCSAVVTVLFTALPWAAGVGAATGALPISP